MQPRAGHRAGLDAALLQALVEPDAEGVAIDLGAGVGTVALSLAARAPGMRAIGVEREPALVACAQAALDAPGNAGVAERVRFVQADVALGGEARRQSGLADATADMVLMNPPFDTPATVRASPDPGRRSAHVAPAGSLEDWTRSAAGLLRPAGSLGLIHRAAALPAILAALERRFGDVRIRPVHATAAEPAIRVLVRATKGSRAGMRLLPGLVLHRPDRAWTQEADAILRGRTHIAM